MPKTKRTKAVGKSAKRVAKRNPGMSAGDARKKARTIVKARKTGKNSAPQPIGMGKKGTMKRKIAASGGGKKTLKTYRSMNKPTKAAARKGASSKTRGDASSTIRDYRAMRSYRGANPTTGKMPGEKPAKKGPTKKTKTVARIAKRKGISRTAANKVRKSR